MRKSIILIVLFALLLIGCNRGNNLGEYVQTTCPIPVPQDLIDSGKFTYGFIKVPEIHNKRNGKTIEIAVAVFKCKSDTATHEPLVLCAGGPGSSNLDSFIPTLTAGLGDLFLN